MAFDPSQNPEDTVFLAGRKVPGIVEIKGLSAPRDFDERQGYGEFGSPLVYKGQKLSRPMLVVRLFDEKDWADWNNFSQVVRRPPRSERRTVSAAALPQLRRALRGRANPLQIRHSLFEYFRVTRVVVKDVSQPVRDDTGVWTIEIKLIQYQPPMRVLARVDGQADDGNDPNAGLRAQIAARTERLQNLMAEEGNRE